MNVMKTSIVIAALALSGCASLSPTTNPNRLTMYDLETWQINCLTKTSDIHLLQSNLTNANSRLYALVTFDPDAHYKNTRQYDGAIETLIARYQSNCPGRKWY